MAILHIFLEILELVISRLKGNTEIRQTGRNAKTVSIQSFRSYLDTSLISSSLTALMFSNNIAKRYI